MERSTYVLALLMATCTVIHGLPHLSLEGTEIQVRGRSADFEYARERRSADEFPTRISVDLTSSDISTHLDLQQNADITDNVPVLLWRDNMVKRYRVEETERVAFYEDVDHGAAIMVSFNKNNNSEDEFLYFGTFMTEDGERLIQPSDEINNKYTISEIEMPEIASMDFKINPNYDQHKKPVHSSDIPSRQRRNVIVYEVEIFFVVDYAIYLNWYEKTVGEADRVSTTFSLIKQYYAFVLNAIDLRYQSVTGHGFNISCLYAGIYIADTPTGALFVEENTFDVSLPVLAVDIDTVLTAFSAWAETFLAPTYYYDHAMLLTGYEAGYISGGQFSTSVAGLAFTPGACTESRYSIGEDINFDSGIGTLMAHELGHNLGSLHDNETENDCFQNDGYVMAPSSGYAGNVEIDRRAYLFSVCSNIYFNDYIDIMNNGGYNCLTSRDANYDVTDLDPYINDIAGQVYSPDQQCEEKYGAGSFLYRSVYNSFEDICTNLYCANPTTDGSYYTTLPWDGTTCGSGKLCRAGYCVASDSVPTVDNEACLFGDVPYTAPFSNPPMTCAELITNSTSYNCYQSSFYESCCSSCEAIRQVESTNCQYGDQAEWCSTLSLFDCYLNDHICCQSCPERSTGIENCQYGDQAEWCSTLSLFDCYANDHICCQSCPGRSTGIENCEYGDKATGCETITPSGCTVNGDTCCETCYVPPSTTTSTTTTTTSTTTSTTSTTTSTTPSTTTTTSTTPSTTTTSTTPSTTTTTSTTPSTTTTSTTSTTTSTTPSTTTTTSTTPSTTTTSTPSTTTTTSTTPTTTSTTSTTPTTSSTTSTTPTTTSTTSTTSTTTSTTPTTTSTTSTTTSTTPSTTTTTSTTPSTTTTSTTSTTTSTTPPTTTTTSTTPSTTTTSTTPSTTTTTSTTPTTTSTTSTTPTTSSTTSTTPTTTSTTSTTSTTTSTTPTTTSTTSTTTSTTPTTTSTTSTTPTTTSTTSTTPTTTSTTSTTSTTTSTTPTTTSTTSTTTSTTPTTTTTTSTTPSTTTTSTTSTTTSTTPSTSTTTSTTPSTTTTSTTPSTTTTTSTTPTTTSTTSTTPTTSSTTSTTPTTTSTTSTTSTTTSTTPTTTSTTSTTTSTTPTTTSTTSTTPTTTSTTSTTPTTTSTTSTTSTTTSTTPTTTSTTSTTTSTTPSTTTTTSTTPTTTSTTSTTTSTTPLTTSTSSTTPLTTTTTSTPSTATTTSTTMSTTSTLPPTTTTITSSTTEGIVKRIVGVKFIFQIDLGNQDINDELIINVRIELTQYYIRTMGNKFIRIIEITLRKGSLIADYKVEMDDTPESSADFTKANLDLVKAEETVTILNKTVSPSSVTINDVTVTNETVSNDENVCQLLIGTKTCADGLECVVTDGNPSCQKIDDKFGLTLVIVAVVAAVVLLFVILGIACLVARMYCGDRKTKYPDSYSTDTLDDSRQYTGYKYPGMAFYGGMNGHHGEKAQGYVSNTREIIPTSHSNRNSRSHHSKDNSYRDNRYSNKRQKAKSPSRPSSKTSNQHRHVYDNRALDYDQILSASYVEPYDRR
ncbi:hypothetical protein ACF0H5_011084 [Mactra antiquata]